MRHAFLLPVLLPVLLVACAPAPDRGDVPDTQVTAPALTDDSPAGDPAAAAAAAREALARRLGTEAGDIAVESIDEAEWPNACLGLPAEDEMCAEVLTPGYALTLVHDGTAYAYRTNERGTVVRGE